MPHTLRRNLGWIGGRVVDAASGDRVAGALVTLNHVIGGGGARQITIYDEFETRVPRKMTHTDDQGLFSLPFMWDPLDLGDAMAVRPTYHLTIQRAFLASDQPHGITRHQDYLARVVNLRAVANGSLPDPREPADLTGLITGLIAEFQGIRLPAAFVTIRDPSPSYYALLGLTQVRAR